MADSGVTLATNETYRESPSRRQISAFCGTLVVSGVQFPAFQIHPPSRFLRTPVRPDGCFRRLPQKQISSILERDLAESVARGHTIDRAEGNEGIDRMPASIPDPFGNRVAAVTMTVPIVRMPEGDFDRFGASCLAAAREVEQRLRL